jgi:hypothetical protein
LPFDWNRTRIEKVIEFLQTDFAGFLSDLSGPTAIPRSKGLRAFRGSGHSFWHDDLEDPNTAIKLQRRIDRFLQLGASPQPKLFVRVLATHDELASADELYAELVAKFGKYNANVYLLVIVNDQKQEETFISAKSPGLMIFFQCAEATNGEDPAPFCEPIVWAVKQIEQQGPSKYRQVASAAALLQGGLVAPTSIGLDGMHGVASFTAMEADKARYVEGARVQAWYWGAWYEATVLQVPGENLYWKVQCDADPPGMTCFTHRLRNI